MKILVIGASNVDIIAKSNSKIILNDSNPGDHVIAFGGVGRNLAIDLAILGNQVTFITPLSQDSFGLMMIKETKKYGIELVGPKTNKSSIYLSIQDSSGDLHCAVSSMKSIDKITPDNLKKFIGVNNQYDIIICETNINVDSIKFISELDHPFKIVELVSSEKSIKAKNFLDGFNLVKGNKKEIHNLLGLSDPKKIYEKKFQFDILMTQGKKDAFYISKNISSYSFKEIESVNTSGAGDAFLAGFISGLSNENPLKKGHESAIRALMSETSYIKVDKWSK